MLKERVNHLKTHSHRQRTYKKICCTWMNHGKGVHMDELADFYAVFEKAAKRIALAKTPKVVYEAVLNFDNIRKATKFNPSYKEISPEFANAYKAAGCYYTIKDLIMFEGCLMKVDENGETAQSPSWSVNYKRNRKYVQKEESLAALERTAGKLVGVGVGECGYMMLGLLKDFLEYNNFNFADTKQKWSEQSELRKAIRNAKRGDRRSRK